MSDEPTGLHPDVKPGPGWTYFDGELVQIMTFEKPSPYPPDFVLGELVQATFIERDGRFLPAIKRGYTVSRYESNPRSFDNPGEAFSHAERQAIELNKPEMARRRQAEKQMAAARVKAMKASDPA